jgi:AAA domain
MAATLPRSVGEASVAHARRGRKVSRTVASLSFEGDGVSSGFRGAVRRSSERSGLLHPRLTDLVLAHTPASLTSEQLAATRALTTDGRGVSVLQALAGTGKTRVLVALARVYNAADYRVIGVAPTGRAA